MFGSRFLRKFKTKRNIDIEPQEIFLDRLAKEKEEEFGISEKKFEVPLHSRALKRVFILSLVIFFVLLVKTFQFQVLENERFLSLADQNKFIFHSIKAERGVIYAQEGEQLVFNQPSFDLVLDKSKLPADDSRKIEILKEIAKIININPNNLEEKINEGNEQKILIAENLDHQTLIILETKINSFPGFQIERNSIRYYKDGPTFSHLLGYIGKINAEELKENPGIYSITDLIGRDGLEKSYEQVLRKNPGKTRIERDVYGNILSEEIVSLPQSGKSLVLWLDIELQKKIEQELKEILEKTGAKKAVGIALNPKTGGLIAMVSLPNYDNNLFNKESDQQVLAALLTNPQEPLFNRVISGLYPTGSTIKPLIATAALEENLISPTKKIYCQGEITIPHKYNPDIIYHYKDWRTHGWIALEEAIAESCDVYFYTIGGGYGDQEGLGPSRIKKYLEFFGWGNKTQIDLPGEVNGFIPSPDWKKEIKKEPWWDGDTYNLSIGQGDIKVTPLQVVTAFGAIANGGTVFQPKVVKAISDKEKNLISEIKPEIIRENFIDPEELQIVREGMRMSVTGENSPFATAVSLNSLPVAVAVKTGTAETPRSNYYHSWVTVFGPYEDPEIVLTIMVENVKNVQSAALSVAKGVLRWYFNR